MIKGCNIAGRIETDIWAEEVSANPKGNIQETPKGLVVKFSTNKLSEIRDRKQALAVANRIAKKWNSQYAEYDEGDILFVDNSLQEEVPILVKIPKRLENKIQVEEEYQTKVREELNRGVGEDGKGEFFQLDSYNTQVKYQFKAAEKILANISKIKQWEKVVTNPPMIWEKIQKDLQIPKEQIELIKNSEGKTVEEKLTSFLANYSYTVEINTAKDKVIEGGYISTLGSKVSSMENRYGKYYYTDERGVEIQINKTDWETAKQIFDEFQKGNNRGVPTQHYSNLTVPGGTNYTENEIATPAITPSIKGHAQFATDNGIGWFRSDEQKESKQPKYYLQYGSQIPTFSNIEYFNTKEEAQKKADKYNEDDEFGIFEVAEEKVFGASKTRRILELQSDLFQKGRDLDDLVTKQTKSSLDNFSTLMSNLNRKLDNGEISLEDYRKERQLLEDNQKLGEKFRNLPDNQFLQLLNKDNNWVTFFVKSIIQDSAKKGYEKVLLPSGNTASKVEGHSTLEEFKKQKEDRVKELEELIKHQEKVSIEEYGEIDEYAQSYIEKEQNEINQLKQELERVETEGFGALKPIYNFYENTVKNVLKKNYEVKEVKDEYGNTWNEVEITPELKKQTERILLQLRPKNEEIVNRELNTALKSFIEKVGGNYEAVSSILDRHGKKVEGVGKMSVERIAGVLKKLVQVVEGKQSVDTLAEETAHLFIELLNKNSSLYKGMYNSITKFQIYEEVKKEYFDIYNGNETLIRKEAIGKLITKFLINKNYTIQEEQQAKVVSSWFQKVLVWFRNLFSKNEQAVNEFKQAAQDILDINITELSDDNVTTGELFQLSPKQSQIKTKLLEEAAKITKREGADGTQKYFISGKEIKHRVTSYVEKVVGKKFTLKRTPEEKELDEIKARFGDKVHADINNIVKRKEDSSIPRTITTDEQTYKKLETYIGNFISELPAGSTFLSEITIYDPKRDIAGTVDLVAIDKEGTVNIFDWKTRQFTKKEKLDYQGLVAHKRDLYLAQISEYRKILRTAYNVEKFDKTRLIPIGVEYSKDGKTPVAVRLGKITGADDQTLKYLDPQPVIDESTGVPELDSLIKQLAKLQEEAQIKKSASPEIRQANRERVNQLYKAIKDIQIKKNLSEFIGFMKLELSRIEAHGDEMTEADLNQYRDTLSVVINMDKVFAKLYRQDIIPEKQKLELSILRGNAVEENSRLEERALKLLEKHQVGSGVENINKVAKAISGAERLFSSLNLIKHPVFKVFWNLISKQKEKTKTQLRSLYDEIQEKVAGITDFNPIVNKATGNLISEYSKEYYEKITKLIEDKEWSKIKDLVQVDEEGLKEYIKKRKADINKFKYNDNPTWNNFEKARRILALEQDFDVINHPEAYKNVDNNWFIKKIPTNKQQWYSKEYSALLKDKKLLDFYHFFKDKMKEFKKHLPVDIKGNFIPNLEQNILEKMITGSSGVVGVEGFKDLMKKELGRDTGYFLGEVNEITGEYEKSIPLYFHKEVDPKKKSYDLGSLLYLFGEVSYNYKNMEEIEGATQSLRKLLWESKEAAKTAEGVVQINKITGQIIEKTPELSTLTLFDDYVNYYLYGIKFKDNYGYITKKSKSKDENGKEIEVEEKYSVNRGISNAMSWHSKVNLGFNLGSGLAALMGGTFNAFFIASKSRYFTSSQLRGSFSDIATGHFKDSKTYPIIDFFDLVDSSNTTKKANELSVHKLKKAYSVELLYAFQRGPDWLVSNGILLSILKNYGISGTEIKPLKSLPKDTKSIYEQINTKDDSTNLNTLLSPEQISRIRTLSYRLTESALGMSGRHNIQGIRLSLLGSALMQFRNWIPMMFYERFSGLNHDQELEALTRGKYISFIQTIADKAFFPLVLDAIKLYSGGKPSDTLKDKIKQLYAQELANNATLDPAIFTEEKFIELYEDNLRSMITEIITVATFLTLAMLAYSSYDDDKKKSKGVKFTTKMIDKVLNEFTFFIDPRSASSIVSHNVIPVAGFLTNIYNLMENLIEQGYGDITGDAKISKAAKPLKYLYKTAPLLSEIDKNLEISE